jgi:hypothetical protein
MAKLLVVSGVGNTETSNKFLEIIQEENPDNIVMINDGANPQKLEEWLNFIEKFSMVFPLERTAILFDGDDQEIKKYISSKKLMNSNIHDFQIGNMVFINGEHHPKDIKGKIFVEMSKIMHHASNKYILGIFSMLIRLNYDIAKDKYLVINNFHDSFIYDHIIFVGDFYKIENKDPEYIIIESTTDGDFINVSINNS